MKSTRLIVSRGPLQVAELFALMPETHDETTRGVVPFGPGVPMLFTGVDMITMQDTPFPLGVAFMRSTGTADTLLVIASAPLPGFSGIMVAPGADHVLEFPPDLQILAGDFVHVVRPEAIA